MPDVDAFSGHIACASSTKSELVIPVRNKAGQVIAVLVIDSDQPDAFRDEDAIQMAKILASVFGAAPLREKIL